MIVDTLIQTLKSQLFLISQETYTNSISKRNITRICAKHRLLTPEFIIVNDQAHGFKRLNRHIKSLEDFPIFIEVEYLEDKDNEMQVIESLDLYCEISLQIQSKRTPINTLAKKYANHVLVERSKSMGDNHSNSTILVLSKLGQVIMERFLEEELEEGLTTQDQVKLLFDTYIKKFADFILDINKLLNPTTQESGKDKSKPIS